MRDLGSPLQAYRGSLLHCLSEDEVVYIDDGLLLVADGRVRAFGAAAALLAELPADQPVVDHRGKLLVPGFIDAHVHYPQTDMIGAYGEQLLEWLETYTFPTERRFEDPAHAADTAAFFIDELLRNGTTSALVLATVHAHSVDAIFTAAEARRLRLIAGKVLMDRNCPEYLQDSADSAYHDSKALIERWHGRGRLQYAITPRFAPTSTEEQLQRAGQLAGEYPDVYIHTHLAENTSEVDWVAALYPHSRSYLDVYDHFGLLRERSVFAHCIHLDAADRRRMADTGAAMAFCPTANLFLGSGLFDLEAARDAGARVGLGTDVGAGTSFNLMRTVGEAYKVGQLAGQALSPERALYLATLGSARALYIDDAVGNLLPGKEADFVVLDWQATPLLARRMRVARDWRERLFALFMLADDRVVAATYVSGHRAWPRA